MMTEKKNLMLPLLFVAFLSPCLGISNEVDYGNWNYRDGAENVNVANIRSITRVLDAWGKRIFKDIKTLLHSQPSDLLPDYSRVRPLSESLNDLFREVSHLQRRITDLNNRLATLEPFFRHHGYREEGEDGKDGKDQPPQDQISKVLLKFPGSNPQDCECVTVENFSSSLREKQSLSDGTTFTNKNKQE
ncbi:hypothetical protein E1301_Tti020530 [Triplophysa tibetana]|uniref:Uncharacterized protein n=1 Tax=Triplophysa tibetana TaxID=1572043 RepID=A0A5A9PJA9_9TELE|nr:hypothetical protein E1301_Tti020530 [Triplophysa tibetana]